MEDAFRRFDAARVDRNLALKEKLDLGPYEIALAAADAALTGAHKKLNVPKKIRSSGPRPPRKKMIGRGTLSPQPVSADRLPADAPDAA
jgi:hypothetical protein